MGKEGWYLSVLVLFSILLLAPAVGMQSAFADGNGSPEECDDTGLKLSVPDEDEVPNGQIGDNVSTILDGEIVTGVCIKSGNDSFTGDESGDELGVTCNNPNSCKGQHSVKFEEDGFYGNDGCYEITGLGTIEVTITTTRDDSTCKDLSHVDVMSETGICSTDDYCIIADGDVCNGLETCDAQTLSCQPGTPLVCDDGNVCTGAETCDAANGCQVGTPLVCDDGNVCTADSCDILTGCANTDVSDGTIPDGSGFCDTGNLGVCAEGFDVCTAGGLTCEQTTVASDEICGDGLDNDCDGVIDNGCELPPTGICEDLQIIDFESVGNAECSQIVDGAISIGGNSVTLQVETLEYTSIHGDHPLSPPVPGTLFPPVGPANGQTVTVGDIAEAFAANLGNGRIGDQPANNPVGNACFFSDTTTFSGIKDPGRSGSNSFYYLTFDDPITSLSLDLYDYADDTIYGGALFNSCNGGSDACKIGAIATLTAFENDDFTNPVAFAEYVVDVTEPFVDGQIANLSIPTTPGISFLSASLTLSAPDIGTGIDNIAFCGDTTLPPVGICEDLDTISFEEYDELEDFGAVTTSTNTVTFKIDDGSTTELGDLPDGIVVTGADGTKFGFSGTGPGNGNVPDQVPCQAALGDLNSLSNNIQKIDTKIDGTDFRNDWDVYDYVFLFDQPVTNLSLDVYDWGDWPSESSVGILTLDVFSDLNGDTLVGTATFSNPADGGRDSCLTLSVQDPDGGSILSARVSSSGAAAGDSGTAIDNITFCGDADGVPPVSCEGDSIEIANHSFEDPVLDDGDFIGSPHNNEPPGVPGWPISNGLSGITVFNPTSDSDTSDIYQPGNTEPDYNQAAEALITGNNVAVTHDGQWICQDLDATLQADTEYTLEVDVGWRNDNADLPNYEIWLRTVDGTIQNTFASLVGGEDHFEDGNDDWITETITHQTGLTPVGEGLPLRICLYVPQQSLPNQVNFDNVRLSTGVDECTAPPASAECLEDIDCSDGLFCNGAEICDDLGICQAGTSPVSNDSVSCTVDSCDEGTDSIVNNPDDTLCDDTLFCNGAETCDAVNGCQAGTSPVADDGVACTVDSCDEGTDTIVSNPDHNACDDGQVCNGAEICDVNLGCEVPLVCEPEPVVCIDCSKPTEFTVLYEGPDDVTFSIGKLKQGVFDPKNFIGTDVYDSGDSITIDSMDFIKPKQTVEANTVFKFSNGDIVEIHTSCSKPLYEGLEVTSGDITLTVESGLVTHVKGAEKGTIDELGEDEFDAIPPTLACWEDWKANK